MAVREHDYLIPLDEDAIIWRYINMDKYISMLENSALFFCRMDIFPDPYEGAIPKKEYEYRNKFYQDLGAGHNIPEITQFHLSMKKKTIVSCWHINDYENEGMWSSYLKDNQGVAIQSSYGKLKQALVESDILFYISRVRYIDYKNNIWYHERDYPVTSYNDLVPLLHKRIEYEYENELRIFSIVDEIDNDPEYWEKQPYTKGMNIKLDIKNIIQKVVVHPIAEEKFVKKVKEISKKYQLEVEQSINKPLF